MPAIKFRAMKSTDIKASFKLILKVANEFLFPTYPEEGRIEFKARLGQIKSKLADEKYISYVAEDAGKIIGIVQGSVRNGHASLGLLFVDKRYHRKGVGTALMGKAESQFMREVDAVKLYSSIHALEFYQTLGYVKTTGLRSKGGMMCYPMRKRLC
ncbi:MAG: GNAT family N-acetyltransferase [Candidatus Thermoplasmatota archaeon]|nr:GNAT family N-acetyltransferase [Candidatus Thermoplasmatota archaeon]MBU4070674.1 GNAT family N-acetyltransferase [Candidatus Thermoplasmatota archaeon]MBU4591773.1 GNAT family N-acetyltransferase [Candidatus Thermoplasmatota archaeon]